MTTFSCPLCGSGQLKSIQGLKAHISRMHASEGDVLELQEKAIALLADQGINSEERAPARKSAESIQEAVASVSVATPVVAETPRLTWVPVGTQLMLAGLVYMQNKDTLAFEQVRADGIKAVVGLRTPTEGGQVWLYARFEDSVLCISEADVINGVFQVLSIPEVQASPIPAVPPTAAVAHLVINPAEDERNKRLPTFLEAVEKYEAANHAANVAGKQLKEAKIQYYDVLCAFTKDFGVESAKDKRDFVVRENGYKSWLICTPGAPYTEYDQEGLVAWLDANGHSDALKKVLDLNAYTTLKQDGQIPDEIVQQFETPKETEDTFKLKVVKEETL
jgi:hypothetical protein